MSELFNKLSKELSKSHKKLERLTAISDMPQGEPWDAIKKAYHSPSSFDKILGTVLNGIATAGKEEFLLSQPLLRKMFEADPNPESRTTINGNEYSAFMGRALKNGLIERTSEPSTFGTGKRIAGTYRVIYPELRKVLGSPAVSTLSSTPISTPDTTNECDIESEVKIEVDNEHEPESECENKPGNDNPIKQSIITSSSDQGQDCSVSNASDSSNEEYLKLKSEIEIQLKDLSQLKETIQNGQQELIPSYRELYKLIDQKIERFNSIIPKGKFGRRRLICEF